MRAKNIWKISSEKSAKNVFLYSHEYRDQKMGGKNARNNFSRNTNSSSKKCWEKNRRKKVRKKFFLYSHEYRELKMGEKTRETIFPETRIVRAKNVGEKIVGKNCEKRFFIFTRIS